MKIKQIITFALIVVAFAVNASPITLRYKYSSSNKIKDPVTVQPIKKRTTIQPINAEQAEHNIKFSQYLVGMNVELVYNEFVVFATQIDSNCCVELPEDLKGEYELRLYCGEKLYSTNIEL